MAWGTAPEIRPDCYAMWLIGLVDFGVEKAKLREVISRWFYMTAVTSRYTGSSETRMEADLARLRPLGTADEFVAELDRICASELTNDFWTIRLRNDLVPRGELGWVPRLGSW